jgi:3-deoxy-7-phosphoheptulonate synthase
MVVIMKREFTPEQLEAAVHTMEEGGVKVMVSKGAETTILGAEGNAEHIDQEKLSGSCGCRSPTRRPTASSTRRTR